MELSPLGKTWLLDIDGTIAKHNGYLEGGDVLLPGAREFFDNLSPEDKVVFITSRKEDQKEELESFFKANNIRFDAIVFNMPYGERILVNDEKPSGLKTAYAINKKRDAALEINYTINEKL